jgi:hypothetical protein
VTILWKATRWGLVLALGLVAAIAIYFSIAELAIYFQRAPATALAEAQREFLRFCADDSLDPKTFAGPERPNLAHDEQANEYSFLWRRSESEYVWISVSFLPHDIIASPSQALAEAVWSRRRTLQQRTHGSRQNRGNSRPNKSLDMETHLQAAASPRMLRSGYVA